MHETGVPFREPPVTGEKGERKTNDVCEKLGEELYRIDGREIRFPVRVNDAAMLLNAFLVDARVAQEMIEESGYRVRRFRDIAKATRKTWDEGVSLIQAPHLYKLAREAGRDALNLLSAIRGMRKAMDRGLIGYGVVHAEKV